MRQLPLLYVLLYKKLDAHCGETRTMKKADARKLLSRCVWGLDHDRLNTIIQEMWKFQMLSEVGRENITLNKLELPDV